MRSKESILQKEEELRRLVRELDDEQRQKFYEESEKRIKDPDTYATLNYIFVAGLHHFYLNSIERGIFNIVIFLIGIMLVLLGYLGFGIFIIVVISIVELYALFRSQEIVQEHNNEVMEEIYLRLKNNK
jgi:hypothetical protein